MDFILASGRSPQAQSPHYLQTEMIPGRIVTSERAKRNGRKMPFSDKTIVFRTVAVEIVSYPDPTLSRGKGSGDI